MKIKQIPPFLRILDYLMLPFMYILGGCKKDSIQQTHGYHTQDINFLLDNSKSIEVIGDDPSAFSNSKGILKNKGYFHMPIFGGWKNYIVIENTEFADYWYIGWATKNYNQIHVLKINQPYIKVLKGKKGNKTVFFGLNYKGEQIKILKKVKVFWAI